MTEKPKSLEELYRDTFSGYEAGVDPGTWERIEAALRAETPAGDATQPAPATKSAAGWVAGGAAIVAVVVSGLLYFGSPEENSPPAA